MGGRKADTSDRDTQQDAVCAGRAAEGEFTWVRKGHQGLLLGGAGVGLGLEGEERFLKAQMER